MVFEDELATLNEWHFFREFTYSKMTFRPTPSQEAELADSIIWIGDFLAVYQLKEREVQSATTPDAEKRWFEKKVLKQATRQIRDTLNYLNNAQAIEIRNHRGHSFSLDVRLIQELHKLIVYLPNEALPKSCRSIKYHRSRTAGLIHIIPANDYLGIVRTLLTPTEVVDYLNFRADLIDKWEPEITSFSESALVGHYLDGDINALPSNKFISYLHRLDHQEEDWDMSRVIAMFPDRITTNKAGTDYYPIVRELASLKRSELREFKKRFQLSLEKAQANEFVLPYRMALTRTNCGFVFVPVTKEMLANRRNGLKNFTFAHKYEMKLPKCIGVSIADDTNGWFTAEWLYAEFSWERDEQLEQLLRNNYPFRKVTQTEVPGYTYKSGN